MIQAEHHSAEPEAVPDQEPRRVTIDMLRHPSIRETVTRAAAIAPPPIRSIGVTRWTALTRRAVWPAARRPLFAVRNVPAGISPARAVDLMEATAADACALKQRAGNKRWRIRAKWHTLTCTFYWQPDPPADEPAVIHEAVDVLRAGELQAAIVRGADDDGPCTILLFNTIHPATGLVHRSRDSYPELLRWYFRRAGVPVRGLMDFIHAAHAQPLRSNPDRAPWYRDLNRRRDTNKYDNLDAAPARARTELTYTENTPDAARRRNGSIRVSQRYLGAFRSFSWVT